MVYRPPKPNKDFLKEFSDFLSDVVLRYDRLLIVGDFNIHVWCELNSLAKDFISLVDSFHFAHVVNGASQKPYNLYCYKVFQCLNLKYLN